MEIECRCVFGACRHMNDRVPLQAALSEKWFTFSTFSQLRNFQRWARLHENTSIKDCFKSQVNSCYFGGGLRDGGAGLPPHFFIFPHYHSTIAPYPFVTTRQLWPASRPTHVNYIFLPTLGCSHDVCLQMLLMEISEQSFTCHWFVKYFEIMR